jgi:hypothetical protein
MPPCTHCSVNAGLIPQGTNQNVDPMQNMALTHSKKAIPGANTASTGPVGKPSVLLGV